LQAASPWTANQHHLASGALKGQHISAQGKAAEAAALGKRHPTPISLFSTLVWRARRRQTRVEKREQIIFCLLTLGERSG